MLRAGASESGEIQMTCANRIGMVSSTSFSRRWFAPRAAQFRFSNNVICNFVKSVSGDKDTVNGPETSML